MAHKEQEQFVQRVKSLHPAFFSGTNVIDFGSLDINGNNRMHFSKGYKYTGVDIGVGKNVDVICNASQYRSEEKFDCVISTEMLEHDKEYVESLKNMWEVCRDGGIIVITAAGEGRPEHGTIRSDNGYSSPFTTEYYKNIVEDDFRAAWNLEEQFSEWNIEHNKNPNDIYFWGIKKDLQPKKHQRGASKKRNVKRG